MKPISHPSKQYQAYNKVLQFLNFPISLCFAIQNLWITALMIAYETPNILDIFIWIIPNIIAILIRPKLIKYVHSVFSARQAELALISHFMLGGTLGCILVALSSRFLADFLRIVVCSLGWTIMDVSFEMASFFCDKTKERLQKLGYKQIDEDSNYSNFTGESLGYLLSFVLCLLRSGKVMKKFFTGASDIYFLGATVSGIYWLVLYFSSYDHHSLTASHIAEENQPSHSVAFNLPGYYELRASSGFDRWLLALHFVFLYIVDVMLIYGSMWIVMVYQQLGEKDGVAYNHGMREGSLVLLAFTMFSYLNLGGMLAKKFPLHLKKSIRYFMVLLIIICLVAIFLFNNADHSLIFLISALIGTANGFYSSNVEPQLNTHYPVFESCSQLVNRIEKLFILCPMPTFVIFVLGRDDISDCLLSLPFAVVVLLGLSVVWKDIEKETHKSSKKKVAKIQKHN